MEQHNENRRYCWNCYYPVGQHDRYCGHCGQKYTTGLINFWALVQDVFESLFNVDSKLFRTIGALFVPGKLTVEYFKGRHQSYILPWRIFFFMAILHFALLGFLGNKDTINLVFNVEDGEFHRLAFQTELDSTASVVKTRFADNNTAQAALDTLKNLNRKVKFDSITLGYLKINRPNQRFFEFASIIVGAKDLIDLSKGRSMEKYDIKGFFEQLQIRQITHLMIDNSGFSRFLIGQFIWMVALMMPALALILKLLYLRRQRYYVEHLVFSLHYHAVAFFLASIGMAIGFVQLKINTAAYAEDPPTIISIAYFVIVIYLFFAMKKVYNQGFAKTFFKYLFIGFSYIIIFIVFFVFTIAVSVLVF